MLRFGSLSCGELSAPELVLLKRNSDDRLKPDSRWTGTPLFQAILHEFCKVAQDLTDTKAMFQTNLPGTGSETGIGGDPAADEGAGKKENAAEVSTHEPEAPLTKESEAIAVLNDHRDWSIAKIAKAIGRHRRTPYRWPTFMDAWRAVHEESSTIPRGSKDGDGHIEAWPELHS